MGDTGRRESGGEQVNLAGVRRGVDQVDSDRGGSFAEQTGHEQPVGGPNLDAIRPDGSMTRANSAKATSGAAT